jgi:hypothetical protein
MPIPEGFTLNTNLLLSFMINAEFETVVPIFERLNSCRTGKNIFLTQHGATVSGNRTSVKNTTFLPSLQVIHPYSVEVILRHVSSSTQFIGINTVSYSAKKDYHSPVDCELF